jgi:ubiquitin carboxyl-terminal hydrolase 8
LKLIECLRDFFKTEELDKDEAQGSQNDLANGIETYEKDFKLLSTPIYFIISLKRFEYDKVTNNKKKISNKVEIPLELKGTDLIEFMYKNSDGAYNDPGIYDLYAVTMHGGNTDGGHYYSYIRKPKFSSLSLNSDTFTPGWYVANDSQFYPLSDDINEKIKEGYIFYYKKRDLDDEYPHMLGNEDVGYKYI